MSTNPNDVSPFAPFVPSTAQPLPMFEAPTAQPAPAEPVKRRRGRPAKPKANPKVVAAPVRRARAAKIDNAPEGAEVHRRKPRRDRHGIPAARKAPRFELQTILRIASTLKEGDQKLFERMIEVLAAMPKAARTRVLTAVQEVFG
jgi:hypothetical protein